MARSFEKKLIDASSEDTLKAAKQLLKTSGLSCMWRDGDGGVNAKFMDRNSLTQTRVVPGEKPQFSCTCRNRSEKMCEHAVALLMHYGQYSGREIKSIDDGASNYAGLKYESLNMLADREQFKAACSVKIEATSAFPHVPSKWENAVLNVKLCGNDREYLGNVNNLRQLFFEKTLSISLKLSDFSLQDQQIIRFLAINGEPDNSCVLLNSEQTAEFFHCLVGFENFFREGRKLLIHGERCEPAILKHNAASGITVSPGIMVEGAPLPIRSAKVITGRAGCWIGRQGEYFFLPATLDVGWLRNFFRTGEQPLNERISENFLLNGKFPLPVVDVDSFDVRPTPMRVLLDGKFSGDREFRMRVDYLYEDCAMPMNSGRLHRKPDEFILRDECAELAFQRELEMFGFRTESEEFALDNPEAAGTFLDQVLPIHTAARHDICFTSRFADLCGAGTGLPPLDLACRVLETRKDSYLVRYELTAAGAKLSFRQVAIAVKTGRSYLATAAGTLVKIPEALGAFMPGAENVLREINDKTGTFELPFHSGNYFLHLTEKLPNARLPELLAPIEHHAAPAPEYRFVGDLRGYQREGVEWMGEMTDAGFNVILADEMGLGKTIQLLSLLAGRKTRHGAPALVICPASLVANWERESRKFVPEFRVAALAGAGRENTWENPDQYDLIITSYATSRRDAEYIRQHKFSFLILDEAQHIKNPDTANALSCKAIDANHRIVLTGTPLENSTDDLWSIFDFLQPGMLGNFHAFRQYYAGIRESGKLQADLAARVSPFLKRRTKAEVGQELPPKQESTLFCAMDPEQRGLYEKIREDGRKQLQKITGGDTKINTEIFTTLLRLRQACCHPGLLPDPAAHRTPSAKFELLQELVLEHIDCGHKLLLFSQFTTFLAKMTAWLDAADIRYEYLDGSTRNRQQRVDNFNNDPGIPLFLLSLKAGGTGLNLTSADTVVICDPWWNPAVELQATDRTHRIGQTRPVSSIKLLVKDSIEEKILALQGKKQEIFDHVIDNPSAIAGKLSIEELRFLLS